MPEFVNLNPNQGLLRVQPREVNLVGLYQFKVVKSNTCGTQGDPAYFDISV